MKMDHKFQWPTMFSGLKGATWANLPNEISAGITLAALIIPLNIGYAQVAGLPPVFGLYAGIIPLAIFALFTSSRHVVGSPDAPISAIMGAMLDRLCAHRRPAAGAICPGPCLDVRPAVFCVLAFSAGLSGQFSVPGRAGRLHHRSGDRGVDQPGQKDPWGCSFNRRIGIGCDGRAAPWCHGHFRRHHGLFCGTHRPVRVHTPCESLLGRHRCGHLYGGAFNEKIRPQSTGGLDRTDPDDGHRSRVRPGSKRG